MEGAALAAERKHERELMVAHHNAAWTGAAYAGKLKPFSSYRKSSEEEKQSGDQILAGLRQLQELGAPMKIEEIN